MPDRDGLTRLHRIQGISACCVGLVFFSMGAIVATPYTFIGKDLAEIGVFANVMLAMTYGAFALLSFAGAAGNHFILRGIACDRKSDIKLGCALSLCATPSLVLAPTAILLVLLTQRHLKNASQSQLERMNS